MWNEVWMNVEQVTFSLFVFLFFWVANLAASLYYNIGINNEMFDWKRLLLGIAKILGVIVSIYFLSAGITLIPYALINTGIVLDEAFASTCNIAIIISILVSAATTYGKETIKTIKDIFTN